MIKTQYQYIEFVELIATGKTRKYCCKNRSSGGILGEVKWYGAWRQYCYFPTAQAVYSTGCLKDICDFIEHLKTATNEPIHEP